MRCVHVRYTEVHSSIFCCMRGVTVSFGLPIIHVPSSKYNQKMQRYAIFFITVNAVHVSGGFSAYHQELKTVHTASGVCQACHKRDAVCTVLSF
jgi:hypothetical protein